MPTPGHSFLSSQEAAMKTSAGLWIDHRKALIVTIAGQEETLLEIRSGVESQPSREDGVPMDVHFESFLVKADDDHQRDYTEQLNQYYAKVDAAVHKTTTLLIFGPGEAKGELKKRLEHAGYAGRILALETVDKLTDPQIAAKVRKQFVHANPITDPA
jgi:hypothetical protein